MMGVAGTSDRLWSYQRLCNGSHGKKLIVSS
jgi:hypothetical protein